MIGNTYLDQIKKFEGYTERPQWDYKQWSNGYGTRASGPNDVIDRAEAERRLAAEVTKAASLVDRFAPGIDPGTRAALTSLTFNAGPGWMDSGLGQAIKAGDLDKARASFLQYNQAGGQVLPGLASRRATEVGWFGQGDPGAMPRGGSMNGGFGMSPTGTAGISGPIQTATPTPQDTRFVDLQPPQTGLGSPPAGGTAPGAPTTPDLGNPFLNALKGSGGGSSPIPSPPAPMTVQAGHAQAPRVDVASLLQAIQRRAYGIGRG